MENHKFHTFVILAPEYTGKKLSGLFDGDFLFKRALTQISKNHTYQEISGVVIMWAAAASR